MSCDDGDECTNDICDESVGCVNSTVPGCCSLTHPCPSGDYCESGFCTQVHCKVCDLDTDCLDPDAGCFAFGREKYCLSPCNGGVCPEGATCRNDDVVSNLCWPDRNDCSEVEVEPVPEAVEAGDVATPEDIGGEGLHLNDAAEDTASTKDSGAAELVPSDAGDEAIQADHGGGGGCSGGNGGSASGVVLLLCLVGLCFAGLFRISNLQRRRRSI
jgi:hypothetical protein